MDILNTISLESNKKIKINFDGGDLSSDSGLFLISEFAHKIGLDKLVNRIFKTNDRSKRFHTDPQNLLQMLYQIIAGYFQDDHSDALKNEPVLTAILKKETLASQPTISRFFNRMDNDTIDQFHQINRQLRKIAYSINRPEFVLFDLDSTLLNTYGHQEGKGYNFHYQANGYHPLVCYDGLTGDLIAMELRPGAQYCSNESEVFMERVLKEFQEDFPEIPCYFRADAGFASPKLYEILEKYGCKYAIRLKQNARLKQMIDEKDQALYEATMYRTLPYAVTYHEFNYQADSWTKERRIMCKIEKPYGQMVHTNTFIVTNFEELNVQQVIQYYCGRGRMENFIKEGKHGFDFSAVSSSSMIVNANRFELHGLAYNLFNLFRRLVLPTSLAKQQIDTLRLKLLKIAGRIVKSSRSVFFKLNGSCPYQNEFRQTIMNIRNLQIQLE
ncbi:MAG: IS1380 family transposase [Bacteroidia bacterium]|nr:IS1380 family transposase [Bacteroidia bacterium]